MLTISLLAFYLGSTVQFGDIIPSLEVAQTMTFLTLAWSSTLNIFVVRSRHSIFKVGFMSNKTIFWTTLFSLSLTALIAAVPFLADIFMLAQLSPAHWAIAIGLSLMIILTVEVDKVILRKPSK